MNTPSKKFRKILESYNATCEKDEDKLPVIRLHDLRHTNATTTMNIYAHALEEADHKASDVLGKTFKIEKP